MRRTYVGLRQPARAFAVPERVLTSTANQALRQVAIQLNFNSVQPKRLFNGATSGPDVFLRQAARPRVSSLVRYRIAAKADGFAQPYLPPSLRQAGAVRLFLQKLPKKAARQIFETSGVGHPSFAGRASGDARGNRSSCADGRRYRLRASGPKRCPTSGRTSSRCNPLDRRQSQGEMHEYRR